MINSAQFVYFVSFCSVNMSVYTNPLETIRLDLPKKCRPGEGESLRLYVTLRGSYSISFPIKDLNKLVPYKKWV